MTCKVLRVTYTFTHKDYYFALCVAIVTMLLHFCGVALSEWRYQQLELEILRSPVTPRLFLFIGVALVINVVGLWSRKVVGLLISASALGCVGVCYLLWYIHSRQFLGALNQSVLSQLPSGFSQPTLPPYSLAGVSWWNLLVLGMVVALFIWETKTLTKTLLSRHDKDL